MISAGLDWSMTCPCICIHDSKTPLEFKNCTFYFYIDNKKWDQSFGNIHGFKAALFNGDEERFNNIATWAMTILKKHGVKRACLEGYSMGSQGRIFHIAENIGLLKHMMWKEGIEFITPAPTAVKKSFTGKGNAKKEQMYDAFIDKGLDVDLEKLLNSTSDKSPIADITDAFAMLHHMYTNPDLTQKV